MQVSSLWTVSSAQQTAMLRRGGSGGWTRTFPNTVWSPRGSTVLCWLPNGPASNWTEHRYPRDCDHCWGMIFRPHWFDVKQPTLRTGASTHCSSAPYSSCLPAVVERLQTCPNPSDEAMSSHDTGSLLSSRSWSCTGAERGPQGQDGHEPKGLYLLTWASGRIQILY